MPIKNIRLIQKQDEVYDSATQAKQNDQYIQALANLGQRTGTKGDSVTLETLSFNDLLDTKYDASSYVGVLTYEIDENTNLPICKYGVMYKEDFVNGDDKLASVTKTSDILSLHALDNAVATDILVNNCEVITKDSLFKLDDNKFAMVLFEKVVNSNSEQYDKEIQYNIFDTSDNTLDFGIRVWHVQSDNSNDNQFAMFTIKKSDEANKYLMDAWLLTLDNSKQSAKLAFEDYLSTNSGNNAKYTMFDLLENIDISDYTSVIDDSSNTIFAYFKSNGEQIGTSIDIEYDGVEQNGFTLVDQDAFKYYDNIIDKYGISILDRISYLSTDVSVMYPRLLEYYSQNVFFKDKKSLMFQMLTKIYESILENEHSDEGTLADILSQTADALTLYIPLSYNLKYYSSSSNALKAYSTTEIYITFINELTTTLVDHIFSDDFNVLVAKYDDAEKIAAYNLDIEYSDTYDDIITSFNLAKVFTLPYIDKTTGNWKINDITTSFKSYMFSNSPQVIMIIYYYMDNDENVQHIILNNIPSDIADVIDIDDDLWQSRTCVFSSNILTGNSTSSNDSSDIIAYCEIPQVSDIYESYFENSVLFTLFDKSVLSGSTDIQSYISNFNSLKLCALWKFNINTNTFDYVKESDLGVSSSKYAFDVSEIFNMRASSIRSMYETNNVFDAIVIRNQDVDNEKQYLSSKSPNFVVYNPSTDIYKSSIETANDIAIDTDIDNNLVLSIKSSDNLTTSGDKFSSLDDLAKKNTSMFLELDGDANSTTNTLYTIEYDTSNISSDTANELADANVESFTSISDFGAMSYILATYQSLDNFIQSNSSSSTNSTDNTLTISFDEYLANYDAPLVDLKEVMLGNTNMVNRVSILSFDKDGNIYNSFIGSPIYADTSLLDDSIDDKVFMQSMWRGGFGNDTSSIYPQQVLQLSSSTVNINLGHETMLQPNDIDKFNRQQMLDVKFDNILVESSNFAQRIKYFDNSQFIGSLNDTRMVTSGSNKAKYVSNNISKNDYTNILLDNGTPGIGALTVLSKCVMPLGVVKPISSSTSSFVKLFKLIYASQLDDKEYGFDLLSSWDAELSTDSSSNLLELWNDENIGNINYAEVSNCYKDLINDLYAKDNGNVFENATEFDFTNNDMVDISSFFIQVANPNTGETDGEDVKVEHHDSIYDILQYIHEDIYIFRLSDYLWRVYGLDMTNYESWPVDEDPGLDSRIIKLSLSGTKQKYAYFIIFFKSELDIKEVPIAIQSNTDNPKYKIAKCKHDITLVKREAYGASSQYWISIFLDLDNNYVISEK